MRTFLADSVGGRSHLLVTRVGAKRQVSSRKDGKQADIDVDYRSSKFPAALVNGHPRASNPDIRAGDNDDRHNQHWTGMNSWWRSVLGIPMIATKSGTGNALAEESVIKANAKPISISHPPNSVRDALRAGG